MCRLLAILSERDLDVSEHLRRFAGVARNSREYQGHGWGCAWRLDDAWEIYKSIRPIWEDEPPAVPTTRVFLAHARSAFRDEGIRIENNMPFTDGVNVFLFNGELRGVRVKEEGRIGAEKVFHFIKRFEREGWEAALAKATRILEKRSDYLRAMNVILSDGESVFVSSRFSEDPDYFTMHLRETDGERIICSEPFPGTDRWQPIGNGETCRFP